MNKLDITIPIDEKATTELGPRNGDEAALLALLQEALDEGEGTVYGSVDDFMRELEQRIKI